MNAAWDTSSLKQPQLYADCDRVFAEAQWNATSRSTGIHVNQPLTEIFTVHDGKIVSDKLNFNDTIELVNALKGSDANP